MRSYARFMHNHGLLGLPGRTQWRTISGGSREYVDRLVAPFADRIRLRAAVHKIVGVPGDHAASAAVELLTDLGPERFDRVIVAAHSDQALELLADASPAERAVLGAISYQPNTGTLHTDARALPRSPRARASWNSWVAPGGRRATVTYWMNALQGSSPSSRSSSRSTAATTSIPRSCWPSSSTSIRSSTWPRSERSSDGTRSKATRGIYFAGAYWGYGFHEDGVQSALEVVRAIRGGRMTAVAVYEGTARHRRLTPRAREFAPRLFLAYLDVDALPGSLDGLPGWSARRPALVRFRRRDFLDGRPGPLGDAVRDLVEARLGRRPEGTVHLLAHLRTFGWLFNPLSVYYCWRPDGALDALVLEVTNTPWGERHWYVIDAGTGAGAHVMPKAMHVSPFLPMDVDYHVSWTAPGDTLDARHRRRSRRRRPMFAAGLALRRRLLDRRHALAVLVRHPAPAAARVARDLPPSAWRCSSPACPDTVIRPELRRRSPHDPAKPNGAGARERPAAPSARRRARARRPDRPITLRRA